MARRLKCEYGTINLLKRNPRRISDNAYMKLRDSVESDPYMLEARGIVVWRVPDKLEGVKSPFRGQEGQLVCLGGNQRCRALLDEGYEEIPSRWVVQARRPDGEWWDAAAAERFVLLDNNPEGMGGENDYEMMIQDFNERMMAAAGIDFSNFPTMDQSDLTDASLSDGDGDGDGGDGSGGIEEEVETDGNGERDPALEEWIQKRERVRKDLPELMETGFYLCLVFETHGQKMEFVEKAGLGGGKVEYEMFTDGIEFSREVCGIEIERSGLHFPEPRVDANLAEMAEPNRQEPSEMSMSTAVAGLRADRDEYERCLAWVRKVEAGEAAGAPPPEMANRLLAYREWAEDELARTDAMLAAASEDEAQAAERAEGERLASEHLAKAAAERAALGMGYSAGESDLDGDGFGAVDGTAEDSEETSEAEEE